MRSLEYEANPSKWVWELVNYQPGVSLTNW